MGRLTRGLGLAALLLLAAAPAAQAKRCSQFHQRDLAPAKHVRLIERANGDGGTDLIGCILPRGKPRQLAFSAEYETETYDYTLRQVAREWVLVDTSGGSQYGGGTATYVFDIRSGRHHSLISSCYEILTGFCSGPPERQDDLAAVFINDIGEAAAVITGTEGVTVAAFSPSGERTDLDAGTAQEIPAASLRLRGSTASWTHSGEPRSAQL